MKRVRPAPLFRALLFLSGICGLVAVMVWRVARLPEPEIIRSTDSTDYFSDNSPLSRGDQNLIPADSLQWCGGGAFLATRKTANERTAFSVYAEPAALDGIEDAPPASQRFSSWMGDFLAGDAKVEEGILLARERRVELKALIEDDPEMALAMSVPLEFRRRLPSAVRELLEERINEEGDFYLGAICFGPKTLKDINFREVELADGRRLKTYTYGRRLDVASKRGMSLHGVAVDDALALHESPLRLIDAVEKEERGLPENEIAVEMSGEVLSIGQPEELVELFEECDAAERNPSRICNYPRILGSELTNLQYQVETDPATWKEAQAHALSVKGRLVVINGEAENDVVANLLLAASANTRAFDGGKGVYAWIGASDSEDANGTDENATGMSLNATEGSWKWTDGTDVNASYENWGNAGTPETNGTPAANGSDYAAMALESWEENSTRKGNFGQWNDLNGSNKLAYVIEFDLGDAPTSIGEVNGTKKILVIRARYEEEQTEGVLFGPDGTILIEGVDVNESQTLDDIHDVMNAVSQYYQDNSNGQLVLEYVATETVNLDRNSTEYDDLGFGTLLKDARAAAAAANPEWDWDGNLTADPSYLSYVVVTKRAHPAGDYGGLAWVGAPGCHVPSWSMGVTAHELGHNFGLSHANYWDAYTESPIGDGFNQEYGNPLSVMGSGGGHLTLAAKSKLGFYLDGRDIAYFVDDNSSPLAVDGNHTFRIYRHDYEKAPYGLKTGLFTVDLPSEVNAIYSDSNPPTVKFEGAGGTDANATVILLSQQVTGLYVTDAGMGFVQEPTVTIVPHEDDPNPSSLTLDASWIVDENGTQNTFLANDYNSSRGLRGIKLPAGDGNFYWISYRHGFDKNGLTVVWGNASGSQNWLIDMTRETPNSYEDGGARIGRTVTDIGSDVHFTPVAHGGEYPSEYIDVVVRVGWNESNNSAPQPDLTVSDFTPSVNETIAFAVDATDADGDLDFAYSWYVDDAMVTDASALNKPSLSRIFSSPGIRKVRVAVSDMKGGVGSATILIRVSEPETHSQARIEGRVLSGGKPVEGARVFMERSIPIIHPVTVQGSMSDSRIPKYYFDGDESPDLILYRGQTHRFLFDAAAGEHPLRFGLEEESKAALAKVEMATGVKRDDGGGGYVKAPAANFSGEYQPYAVKLATLLENSPVETITVTYGGSGYDPAIPPSATLTGVDEDGAVVTDTITGATDVNVSGVGTIDFDVNGSGYPAAPSVIVVGNGKDFTATATFNGGAVSEVNVTATGSGYVDGSTFVKLVYPTNPKGYWPLDDDGFTDGSGATVLRDYGETNPLITDLNGTLVNGNAADFAIGQGKVDDALDFDGSRYVDLLATTNAALGFNTLDEGSISFWYQAAAEAEFRTIFSVRGTTGDDFKIVLLDTGQLQVAMWDGIGGFGFETNATTFHGDLDLDLEDDWHHVVFVVDATGNTLYVDGVDHTPADADYDWGNSATQAFIGDVAGIDDVSIGRWVDDATQSFIGRLDEFYLYDRELNSTEIDFLNDLGTGAATMAEVTAEVDAVSAVDVSNLTKSYGDAPTITIDSPIDPADANATVTAELTATSVKWVYVDTSSVSPIFEIVPGTTDFNATVKGYESLPDVNVGASPTGNDANATVFWTPTGYVEIIERGYGYLIDLNETHVRIRGAGNRAPEYEILMEPAPGEPGYFVIKALLLVRAGEGSYTDSPRIVLSGGGEIMEVNESIHPPSEPSTFALLADLNTTTYFTVNLSDATDVGNGLAATIGELLSITVNPAIEDILFSETPILTVVDEPYGDINATSVTMQQDFVAAVTVTDGGKGYTRPVEVAFHGGFGTDGNESNVTQATAHAVLDENGSISGIVIDSNGTNYTSVPEISITGGGGVGVSVEVIALIGGEPEVVVLDGGSGYRNDNATNFLSVRFDGTWGTPDGWEANATAYLGGQVASITVLNGGEEYIAPSVTITGDGTGATAHAKVQGGQIVKIVIDEPGAGYTDANVTISGGRGLDANGTDANGTDADCTAIVANGQIERIIINSGGFGYFAPVVVVEGTGSGVVAYPVVENGAIARVVIDLDVNGSGSGFTETPTLRLFDFARDAFILHDLLEDGEEEPVDAELKVTLANMQGDEIVWVDVTNGGNDYNVTEPTLVADFIGNDENATFAVQISNERRLWAVAVNLTASPQSLPFESTPEIYFYHDPNGDSPLKEEIPMDSIHGHGAEGDYLDIVVTDDLPNEFYYYSEGWNGVGMGGRIRVVDSSPELHWWNVGDWEADRYYHEGTVVAFDKIGYVCLSSHTSTVFKDTRTITFERVNDLFPTWDAARIDAASRGGILATFLMQAEWDKMLQEVGDINATLFLGGFQPAQSTDPGDNWQWVSGEAWDPLMDTNWNTAITPPQPQPFHNPGNVNNHPERWLVVDRYEKWRVVHNLNHAGSVEDFTINNGGTGYTPLDNVAISGGGGSGAQGNIPAFGVNLGGTITDIDVTPWPPPWPGHGGGGDYTDLPDVTIGGGGTGAQITAVMTGAEFGYILEYEDKSDLANGYWMRLGQAPWVLDAWQAGKKYHIGDAVKIGDLGEEETYVCLQYHEESSEEFETDLAHGFWLKMETDKAVTYVKNSDPALEGFWSVVPQGLETYTDAEGYYAFTDLEHGLYSVGVDMEDENRQPISYDDQNTTAVVLGGFDELTLQTDDAGEGASSLVWSDESIDSIYGQYFPDWVSGRKYLSYRGFVNEAGLKYVCVKDHVAGSTFTDDLNASWKRADKHLGGIGYGFASKPALTILPDEANTGNGKAVVDVSVATDGTLDLTINDDSNDSKIHDPNDRFVVRTNSWTQGIDFWESGYGKKLDADVNASRVVISPNSSLNGIELPIYWETPWDNNVTFTATLWDADGNLITDGNVTWDLLLDFNATSGDNNSSIMIADSTTSSASLAIASTLRKGQIVAIDLNVSGSGYTSAPTVTIYGDGTGATATATVSGGVVDTITVTAGGSGYSSVPVVALSGGGGAGASAEAVVGGKAVLRAAAANSSAYDEVTIIVGNLQAMTPKDVWRDKHFDTILDDFNATFSDSGDADDDNLTNAEEFALGTNPLAVDTDGDGISDSVEINGSHTYEQINGAFTWTEAKTDAESKGGFLATITSSSENDKVTTAWDGNLTVWLGGTDSAAEGNWTWVTEESWSYDEWIPPQPSNSTGTEDYLILSSPGEWNASSLSDGNYSYVLERVFVTDPVLADTDGDGLSDGYEVYTDYNGTTSHPLLVDTDGDGVSDGDEVAAGDDPTDKNRTITVSANGIIYYSGDQSGNIYVTHEEVALGASPGDENVTIITGPGYYTLSNLDFNKTYQPFAFLDANGDGNRSLNEAYGQYADSNFTFASDSFDINVNLVAPPRILTELMLREVIGIDLNASTSDYTDANVTISGGGGSGAEANATIVAPPSSISSITVTNGGSGYVSVPTVTITGDGADANATAVIGYTANYGESFSLQISADEFPTDFNDSDTLPPWLDLNKITGLISGTPDETAAGFYDFNVTAKNSAGTAASEAAGEGNATFTIFVPDVLPPIITLNGNASVTHEVSSIYVDAGAVWTDNLDGNGTVDANGTVDVNALGIYYLTYDLTDTSENSATQVVRTVTVEDATVPVIVLLGDANVTHEANATYVDAGATWTDNLDGNGTVDANGTVDVNALGTYYLYYDLNDTSENNATQVVRRVTVEDTTAPVIALVGDANVTHEMNTTYVDAGATWTDSLDGNGTVDANGTVDVSVPGTYYLTYDLNDSSENNATRVIRSVTVEDATVPVIVLLGDANVTHEANATYVDAGATWTDNLDGNGTVEANGTVKVAELGTYYLYYDRNDTSGNAASQVIRAVTVVESIAPVITLQGDANATHEFNTAYLDAGATWIDNLDGNGTVEANGMVDATTLGVYYLYYDQNDTFGNAASQVIRAVTVVDTTAPLITLIGDANVTHEANATYADTGATWLDSVDGNGTVEANGTVTGAVDATAPGVYYLYYDLNDTSQNAAAQAIRTVTVVDTTAPLITLLGETLLTHSSNGAFVDPGVNATDFADGNLTSEVETTGTVVAALPGVYFLYYNVSDAAGNAAAQAMRLVTVVDAVPPIITLSGETFLAHDSDVVFVDPNASAIDGYDGNLTAEIQVTGAVDVTMPGVYFLYYDVNDTAGNAATQGMRTVIVEDKTPPTITLAGASPFALEVADQFVDPGAYAIDSYEGNLTSAIQVTGTIDTSVLGDYYLYYDVNDTSGNAATRVARTISVGDFTGPVVTPIGEASVSLMIGETYEELGATAIDAYEGILTADVSDPGQIVDTSKTGEHTITYEATDSAGNAGQAVRIVTISHALVLGGRAIDGYLAGATVIFDGDGDGVHDLVDTNETDSSGEFALAFTSSELDEYDKDDNGQIDAGEGIFILSGGVDSSTGTAFDGSLTALPGSTVVTPLTTLIVSLVQQGKDADDAASLVSQAFGIDSSVDLSSYDPLEKATEADPQAATVLAAGAQVMNVMLQTTATIDYASNQNLSSAAVSLFVADQLASVVSAATAPIDLASDLDLLSTITSASLAASDPAATLSSSDLAAAAQLTASINDMVADSLAANANDPESLAVDAARIRIVAAEAVTSVVDALEIEGGSLSSVAESVDSDYLTSYLSNVKATNVFAPTSPDQVFAMARSRLTLGATLRDLNATDKDGTTSSTFAIVTGNFDYDGDGENAFTIDSASGEITVTDPTDLELHPFESVELTVKLTDSGGLSSSTTVRAHVDAPNLLHGEGSSLETDSGWWSVQWFGNFHSLDSGWIYHADQGWLYVSGESTLNSLWLWDPGLEAWIWTNESVYPFVYRHDDEIEENRQWLYFGSETAAGQYYDYSAEAWIPK